MQGKVRESVKELATVYTDAWKGYRGLSDEFIHEFIDHTVMYALGQVHTNGIENFWSLLKRCLKGTYVSVEPFHLKRYIDEMVFRFNHREGTDRERFVAALSMVKGKRLTFDELTTSHEAYFEQIFGPAEKA
jgi:transposase-like protein